MDLLELSRKGGMDGDVDSYVTLRVLVEGIRAKVSSRIGAEYGQCSRQRGIGPGSGYPCRDDGSAHPEAGEDSYFPDPAGATASQRASLCCDPAGLRGMIHKFQGISKSQVSDQSGAVSRHRCYVIGLDAITTWDTAWTTVPRRFYQQMRYAPSSTRLTNETGRPCAASLAPSSLSSTTNGPLAVDTSHLSR